MEGQEGFTMPRIIGIDEAGYGPNLGPLVMTAVTCQVPDSMIGADLWHSLRDAVRRSSDPDDGRMVVDDSKLVYSSPSGLAGLEAAVWSVLHHGQPEIPRTVQDYLDCVGSPSSLDVRSESWFTGKTKQQLLWEAMLYFSERKANQLPSSDHLFQTEPKEYPLPYLERNPLEDAFDEMELLGFSLLDPFQLLPAANQGDTLAKELLQKVGKRVHLVGYMVTTKDTRTIDNKPMHFGTFYDRVGEVFDTVHFPNIAIRYPFRGRGFYSIKGKVVEDFGVSMVEVDFMDKLPMVNPRARAHERVILPVN